MRWLVLLVAIAAATGAAFVAPGWLPVALTDKLNQMPGTTLCSFLILIVLVDVAFEIYLHFHVPDNRKALWTLIKTCVALMIMTVAAPPGWAIFKQLQFNGNPQQWMINIQMAEPSLPWQAVAIFSILAVCLIILCIMFSREKQQESVPVPTSESSDDMEWQHRR